MDGLDTITDGIGETSMEIFEVANPIGSKRRAVIETFESEVEKDSELLVRKANQEKARDKQQRTVGAYKATLGDLGDSGSDTEYEQNTIEVGGHGSDSARPVPVRSRGQDLDLYDCTYFPL